MSMTNDEVLKLIDEAKKNKSKLAHITDKKELSTHDKFKISLCKLFVQFMNEKKMTGTELSKLTKIPNSRISEITHYKIKLVTVDQLLKYLSILADHSPKIREHLHVLEQALDIPLLKVSTAKKLTKELKTIEPGISDIRFKYVY